MAYVFSKISSQSDTGATDTTFTPSNPVHAVDDIIIHIIANDLGNVTITASAGWTELGTQSRQSNNRGAVFYKKATSASEADPTFTGDADGWAIVSLAIRDADPTTPIDDFAQNDIAGSTKTATCSAITTTSDDCLILRCLSGWDVSNVYGYAPDLNNKCVGFAIENITTQVHAYNQETAGSSGTFDFDLCRSDGGRTYTIGFKNKTDGGIEPKVVSGMNILEKRFGYYGVNAATLVLANLYDSITTLAGFSVSSATPIDPLTGGAVTTVAGSDFGLAAIGTRLRSSETLSNVVIGFTFPYTGDLSGKKLLFNLGTSTSGIGSLGRIVILFDSLGNYSAFNHPRSEGRAGAAAYPLFIDESSPTIDTSGTLDWTDISKIGVAFIKTNTAANTSPIISLFSTVDTMVFSGCNSARPITPAIISPWLENGIFFGVSNLQGSGQFLTRVPIQIGDGTKTTYFKAEAQSTELPSLYGKGQFNWLLGDNSTDIIIKTSASDDIDFSASVFATSSPQDFTIDATSSTSATFNFSGCSFVGWNVTWLTGVDCDSASFIRCVNVDAKAATFTNCVIKNSTSTTNAMKVNNGASITDCSFTKGDETYAINIQDAGSYDLSNNSYSGYTKPLYVSATTGTVTITLAFGESQPTYDSDGATVAFNQPQSVGSVTNIVAGSRIQVWNTTTASEIANEIVAGTTYTLNYDDGVEFTSGDTVRIRLTQQATTTAYLEFQQSTTVALAGWSVLADQQADTVYNGMGIDGSTVTKFSADYIDNEIDLDVASNFAMSEFYPWWVYNMTTENGIREFYGAIEAEDAANIKNDTTVLGLHWDNTTASNVYQTDNIRFYRSDGAYPVKDPTTGGGGIDIVWKNQIFIAETTTSGLTAQESADLAIIKTRTGLIPATV